MIRHSFPVAAIAVFAVTAAAADTGFIDKTYKDSSGTEHKYVVFVPHNYKKGAPTPTILFLHGAGETKQQPAKQKEGAKPKAPPKMPVEVGIGPAIKKREKTFPFLTIIPQAPRFGWGAGSEGGKLALAILDEVEKEYTVDNKRLYLTGLSMGGMGTWSLGAAHPEKWAAIVPICGGVFNSREVDETAKKLKDIPIWCCHGDKDTAVKVERSRELIDALKKLGVDPKYTEYPGVGHNSWDKAYDTDELYEWMSKQSKK